MLHLHSSSNSQRVVFVVSVWAINVLSCPNFKGSMPTTAGAPFKLEIRKTGESKALWSKVDAIRSLNTSPKKDKQGKETQAKPQGRSVIVTLLKALLEDAPADLIDDLATYVKDDKDQKLITSIPDARAKAERGDIDTAKVKDAVKHYSDAEWEELVAARKAIK